MPNAAAIRWFKSQFHTQIEEAVKGTPFTLDLLTAIACRETSEIWNVVRHKLTTPEVLALCVGDTLDRKDTFPKNKADLVARPRGQEMFNLARQALVDMSKHIKGYQAVAAKPTKFCHGFGIFQYDIQFFPEDPDYFLQRRWADFDASLAKAIGELKAKQKKIGLGGKTTLTDLEMVAVAIAYNTGGYKPSLGLQQGHNDGKFYGQAVFDYLRLSRTVPIEGVAPVAPPPGTAPLPPPTPVTATGAFLEVDVVEDMLRVRSEPDSAGTANIIARLPDGHIVRAVTGTKKNGFLEVETSLNGAHIRGFASAKFLKPSAQSEVVVAEPSPMAPSSGITAVYAPPKPASLVTKRTGIATALSLNENGQPGRIGQTPEERRAELAAIIEWLAVDKASHKRYLRQGNTTFCNIYAHDYCHLAGCYLPRVWWAPASIEALTKGETVEPLLPKTIKEQRANALFHWLEDFGLRFGWRQTGTLTKLQTEVNQGAIGLIVALRVDEETPGHIVMVVPETNDHRARRDSAGEVIAALESQAGITNFRYGAGKLNWWKDAKFAESAFWLHA